MTHRGIDIYSGDNSPPPDFKAAYADLKEKGGGDEPFLIIKATEGLNYINPFFAANLADAKAAGFKALAAYHFFHPSLDAGRQVAFFRAAIGLLPGELDDEAEDSMSWSQISTAVNTFLRTPSEAHDGHYLNGNFWHNESGVKSAPLWWPIASGTTPAGTWITQDQGYVKGFSMLLDVNTWVGTEDQFATFFELTPPLVPLPPYLQKGAQMVFQYANQEHTVDVAANGDLVHRFYPAGMPPAWGREVRATGCTPGGTVGVDPDYTGNLHLYAPRPDGTMQHCWWDPKTAAWSAEVLA